MNFFKIKNKLYGPESIYRIDCTQLCDLRIVVQLITGETLIVEGIEAIEIAMQAKPSIVEGKRFKFKKFAWVLHNLIGHPLMQILAFFRAYRLSLWIHEITIPKPKIDDPLKYGK